MKKHKSNQKFIFYYEALFYFSVNMNRILRDLKLDFIMQSQVLQEIESYLCKAEDSFIYQTGYFIYLLNFKPKITFDVKMLLY